MCQLCFCNSATRYFEFRGEKLRYLCALVHISVLALSATARDVDSIGMISTREQRGTVL